MLDASLGPASLTRREMMTGSAAAIGLAPVASAQPAPNTPAATAETGPVPSGTVFEDADGSGQRFHANRGLPGIVVSMARTWRKPVPTVAGRCRSTPGIPCSSSSVGLDDPGRSGDAAPALRDGIRSVRHARRSRLPFRGPAAVPQPESIDFPLRRQEEESAFSVILFTDTQPGSVAGFEAGLGSGMIVLGRTGIRSRNGSGAAGSRVGSSSLR